MCEAIVSRSETSYYHSWAEANPALLAASIREFHAEHPIEQWSHRVDFSLSGSFKLIAIRREKPFASTAEYLADDRLYLKEIGL